jgi:TonB family protein
MISLVVAVVVAATDVAAMEAPIPPLQEVRFAPLLRSERRYAELGPVGPFYPMDAVSARKSGEAVIECMTGSSGELKACKVISETPAHFHFGDAAVVMARRKRIFPVGEETPNVMVRLRVPFALGAPVEAAQ